MRVEAQDLAVRYGAAWAAHDPNACRLWGGCGASSVRQRHGSVAGHPVRAQVRERRLRTLRERVGDGRRAQKTPISIGQQCSGKRPSWWRHPHRTDASRVIRERGPVESQRRSVTSDAGSTDRSLRRCRVRATRTPVRAVCNRRPAARAFRPAVNMRRPARAGEHCHPEWNGCVVDVELSRRKAMVSLPRSAVNMSLMGHRRLPADADRESGLRPGSC